MRLSKTYVMAVFVLSAALALFFLSRAPSARAANPYIQNVSFGQDEQGDFIAFDWIGIPETSFSGCWGQFVAIWFNRENPAGTAEGQLLPENSTGDFLRIITSYSGFGGSAFASVTSCGDPSPAALPVRVTGYISPGFPPHQLSFDTNDFITIQVLGGIGRFNQLLVNDPERYFYHVPANPIPVIPYANVTWGFDEPDGLHVSFDWVGQNRVIFMLVGFDGIVNLGGGPQFIPDETRDIAMLWENCCSNNPFSISPIAQFIEVERGRHYSLPVEMVHVRKPFVSFMICGFPPPCPMTRSQMETIMGRGFAPDDYITIAFLSDHPFRPFNYLLNDPTRYYFRRPSSNVAFLPGFMGSRLYKQQVFENQLWEPNRNVDVEKLFLDGNGSSIDPSIYTRDIIDESNIIEPRPLAGFNIYKNFIAMMDEMKDNGLINEWRAFPYDWRLPLEDLVNNGTQLKDSRENLIQEIGALASSSATGKVTLVTHSNGGLLAKVLINKLRELGKDHLIDRLIMVASPQLGTPAAIAGLLHGDDQEIPRKLGFLVSKSVARDFGENMVSAYNLLPSEKYFTRVLDPVVEFTEDVRRIEELESFASTTITSASALHAFLTGNNGGWSEPDTDQVRIPNVLKSGLLLHASTTHESLDVWAPPSHIEITQIAGWGKDTLRGIEYDDCDICIIDTLENMNHAPIRTSDGDGTVVIPSATALSGVQVFYINLKKYNAIGQFKRNRAHADILEVEPLQELIRNIIQNNVDLDNLPRHTTTTKPIDENPRLRLSVHSPVSLDIFDSFGNHTGLIQNPNIESDLQLIEEQIPNSSYESFGDGQYVSLDTRDRYTLELRGLSLGTFTLEIQEVLDDQEVGAVSFINIPVVSTTKAVMSLQTINTASELEIDLEGDGVTDFNLNPMEGANVEISLEILARVLNSLDADQKFVEKIVKEVEKASVELQKEKSEKAIKRLDKVIKRLEKEIKRNQGRLRDVGSENDEDEESKLRQQRISTEDAQALIQIIRKITFALS